MTAKPRIHFKELQGFPTIGEKISTEAFLNAAQDIVKVIGTFGKLFTPVVNDMQGNVTTLAATFESNKRDYHYLEDLIIINIDANKSYVADALLWLKRALEMICVFFENIVNDEQRKETLRPHLQNAYDKTLKPYHGFFVKSTVKLIYCWVPTRSQLIGEGSDHDENMKFLENFLPKMRDNLNRINSLLKKHGIEIPIGV